MKKKFSKDLLEGQIVEQELANLLIKRNPYAQIEFNTSATNDIKQLRKYDFILSNGAKM
jgi:hypothetical protein